MRVTFCSATIALLSQSERRITLLSIHSFNKQANMMLKYKCPLASRIGFLIASFFVVAIAFDAMPVSFAEPPVEKKQTDLLSPAGIYFGDSLECQNGVVVSVSDNASDVGVRILQSGGNAVDAAIATAFALAVTYPAAGNIGGGGFMLVHPAPGQGEPVAIDYRETAPAASEATMFTKEESQYEPKSVAIPGTVRGLELAHQHFGSMPWSALMQPAIHLARDGYIIAPSFAVQLNEVLATAPNENELQRVFGKTDKSEWKAGDRLVQPDLAQTLESIAKLGAEAFYAGPIAESIVGEMKRKDGIIALNDLAMYRAVARKPLSARYRDQYDVYATPMPSAGGFCLTQELNMLNNFDIKQWGRWSPEFFHVMCECMRRANYDRARYVGDPSFVKIPTTLTSAEYGREQAATIDLKHATDSLTLASELPIAQESEDTTHFSIVDKNGMAVSNTYTLERIWGSRIVVQNRGFLLNNNMRAFNIFPGESTASGKLGTTPNTIEPGKRPMSSQNPTIVARDGKVVLVTGSPGSQAIPHTILGILVSTIDYQMPLVEAVNAPRFSNQWLPDRLAFEAPERYPVTMEELKHMGHNIVRVGPLPQGDAHSIWISPTGQRIGVADRRRNNQAKAAGY